MAVIRYDKANFLESMEPGISALVISSFNEKLEEKINGIIDEVFQEMKAELPDKVKATIISALNHFDDIHNVKVEVEMKGLDNPQTN